MYARWGLAFLLTAVIPPLILDGQTFTNALIALGLVLTAVAIALVGLRRATLSEHERRVCGWIVFAGAFLAIGLVAILPREYAYQMDFNRRIEEIRRKNREAIERASSATSATEDATERIAQSPRNSPAVEPRLATRRRA